MPLGQPFTEGTCADCIRDTNSSELKIPGLSQSIRADIKSAPQVKTLCEWALYSSLASLICCCLPVGIVPLLLGLAAFSRTPPDPSAPMYQARIGVICGALNLIFFSVLFGHAFYATHDDAHVFRQMQKYNQESSYEEYLKRFPNGKYVDAARGALKQLHHETREADAILSRTEAQVFGAAGDYKGAFHGPFYGVTWTGSGWQQHDLLNDYPEKGRANTIVFAKSESEVVGKWVGRYSKRDLGPVSEGIHTYCFVDVRQPSKRTILVVRSDARSSGSFNIVGTPVVIKSSEDLRTRLRQYVETRSP